jgi:hemerythrin-like domain-containing protein
LISLRDNNIHKQANLSAVRALINQIDEHIDKNDNSYIPMAESILSKLNFRIYAGDELNGDLITPNLS